ncbi:MAG TPA: hypothetical protein VIA06_02100 [Candidatus Dormibacteraeota bacterium]|jgi:hypothetical protein|nr:hypothetical protein [Candidatus Dormibacteraeota bacterium]
MSAGERRGESGSFALSGGLPDAGRAEVAMSVCALCGEEAPDGAGCAVALYVAESVRVGEVWLPLCSGHIRELVPVAREQRRNGTALPCRWTIRTLLDDRGRRLA